MNLQELLQTCVREKTMLHSQSQKLKQQQSGDQKMISNYKNADSIDNSPVFVDPTMNQIEFSRLIEHGESSLKRVTELDTELEVADKELKKSAEEKKQLEADCNELRQNCEQVKNSLQTLKNKYVEAQGDTTLSHDLNNCPGKKQAKKNQVQPVVDLSKNRSLYFKTHSDISVKLLSMEYQLEEKSKALQLALQREKFNENYCRKLSATVENLLLESKKRLQIHLEEKKAAMEEKKNLLKKLDEMKKSLKAAQQEKDHWRHRFNKLESEMSKHKVIEMPVIPIVANKWRPKQDNVFLPIRNPCEECSEISDCVNSEDIDLDSFGKDSQFLVQMLQQQLDNINEEISVLQKEKRCRSHHQEEMIDLAYEDDFQHVHDVQLRNGGDSCLDDPKSCTSLNETDKPKITTMAALPNSSAIKEAESVPCYAKVNLAKKALNGIRPTKYTIKSSLGRLIGKKGKMGSSKEAMDDNINNMLSADSSDVYNENPDVAKKEKLLEQVMADEIPFTSWDNQTIKAWLELWIELPSWYILACQANVKSGTIMTKLSDEEIHKEIGINHPLHRLKLRLATREINHLTCQSNLKCFQSSLAMGSMNHTWIADEWLPSLGLAQYRTHFLECLIDGRMLEHLTKKNLRHDLKISDSFHRNSLLFGIQCLKRLDYDREELERRRNACYNKAEDLLVWSNQRVISWLESIGLQKFAGNLSGNGVHGAMLVLDDAYDAEALALSMQIPIQNMEARNILQKNLIELKKARLSNRSKITPKISSKWETCGRPLPCLPVHDQQSIDTVVYDYP